MDGRQETWIDKVIREATERGEFDGLPGAGKPLDLSDTDDPDWWVKRLIQRERLDTAALLPPRLALRRPDPGDPADDVPRRRWWLRRRR